MSNLALNNEVYVSNNLPNPYVYRKGKGAVNMPKTIKSEIDDSKIEIVHIVPKIDDIEKEKKRKKISNDLYEIFSRIKLELNI